MKIILDYEETSLIYVAKDATTEEQAYKAYARMLKKRYPEDHPESLEELYRMLKESETLEVVDGEDI